MRLWVGPESEFIELDPLDASHSMHVAENPEMFGLNPDPIARHLESFNAGDMDFDYDTIIVMAEMNGWVRVSRDSVHPGHAAVSASCLKDARRAAGALMDLAPGLSGMDLVIERIEGRMICREYASIRQYIEEQRA